MSTTLPIAGMGPGFAPELAFTVRDGGVLQHAAVPTLRFAVGVDTVGAAAHKADGTSTQARSTGINAGAREPIDPRMPNLSPA